MRNNIGAPLGGGMAQQNWGMQYPGAKRLFYSRREQALLLDATLKGGYGPLTGGQVMAIATADGRLVPYIPDTVVFGTTKGVARAIADVGNAVNIVYVTMDDSYKFEIGDSLILAQDATFLDGGAITAIDRTTDDWRAKITFTNATAVATYTMANNTHCYVKAGSAGKFSTAKFILDIDVDTGYGKDSGIVPTGALASVVVSNAVLYKNSLVDYDAQVLTDLGTSVASIVNNFLVLR